MRDNCFNVKLFLQICSTNVVAEEKGQSRLPHIGEFLTPVKKWTNKISDYEPFESCVPYTEAEFLILDQPFSETLSREVFENLLKETTAESVDSSANPGTKEDIQKTEELSNVSSVQNTVSLKQKFKCESCNHKLTSKHLLVLHTYLEHKGFLYLCPVDPKNCTNSFRMKPGIKYHVEKVHTECTDDYSKGLYPDCVMKRMQVSSEEKKQQIQSLCYPKN